MVTAFRRNGRKRTTIATCLALALNLGYSLLIFLIPTEFRDSTCFKVGIAVRTTHYMCSCLISSKFEYMLFAGFQRPSLQFVLKSFQLSNNSECPTRSLNSAHYAFFSIFPDRLIWALQVIPKALFPLLVINLA